MKVALYNQQAQKTGMIELPNSVFDLPWNADLVHQVLTSYAANRRRGTAHTKFRGEVRGGGRKPWIQKGTGRARHGSIRSPIWVGGGVAHGPRKEKIYKKKIPKKMASRALKIILSAKARANEVIVLESLQFAQPKTHFAAQMFENFSKIKEFGNIQKGRGVLVLLSRRDENLIRAIRNLPYADIKDFKNLNAYEAARYKYLMFTQNVIFE